MDLLRPAHRCLTLRHAEFRLASGRFGIAALIKPAYTPRLVRTVLAIHHRIEAMLAGAARVGIERLDDLLRDQNSL